MLRSEGKFSFPWNLIQALANVQKPGCGRCKWLHWDSLTARPLLVYEGEAQRPESNGDPVSLGLGGGSGHTVCSIYFFYPAISSTFTHGQLVLEMHSLGHCLVSPPCKIDLEANGRMRQVVKLPSLFLGKNLALMS